MTPDEIRSLLTSLPSDLAAILWQFSEVAGLPLGESAPLMFGMAIGCPGTEVKVERCVFVGKTR